jgi:rhomboid protease GluP
MEFPAVLTLVFLSSAWVGEAICQKDKRRTTPTLTLMACALLTMCLIAQLRFPQLLILLERNTAKIVDGEWWRLITALFFQDGWIIGGLTNIVALFFVGDLVEQIRSRRDWLLISIVGALVAECVALRWQPIGAGNSIATCSLAGSLISFRPPSQMPPRSKILRIFASTSCLVLVATGDVHGVAGMAGILLGVLIPDRKWIA